MIRSKINEKLKKMHGKRFNLLTIIGFDSIDKYYAVKWKCICDCGNEIVTSEGYLKRGHTKSCGCLKNRKRYRDIVGQKFHRLTVLEFHHIDKHYVPHWECRCDCGNIKVINGNAMKNGRVRSCGCLQREYYDDSLKTSAKTHGMSGTKIYWQWSAMKFRCKFNVRYIKKGIKVCKRWLNSFENFYKDMRDCPKGMSLDRIDNSGNYQFDNCRWATKKEQMNNRDDNVKVRVNGIEMTLKQWCDKYGIGRSSVNWRVKNKNETHRQATNHFSRKL